MNSYDLDILQLAARGYCCSQIVVKMGLDLYGEENPSLIRAMAGLCRGIDGEGSCGVLTGGACLLGCYGGKGEETEEEDERLPLMLSELQQWFSTHCQTRFSGISCREIVPDGTIDAGICGGLVRDCYAKCLELLIDNGFDPEHPHDR